MKFFVNHLASFLLFAAWSASALASPVSWTLTNVIFDTGGTMTGSFTWNADTSSLTNISIQISGGSEPSLDGHLTTGSSFSADFFAFNQSPATGNPGIHLNPNSSLTDAGGTLVIDSGMSFVGVCIDSACNDIGAVGGSLFGLSGSLVGTPVSSATPECSTLALLVPGLIGLASVRLAGRVRSARL